ncbi:inositol phospholipid synthesis protein Scs3p [Zalerion maritima]|uniref:Acyl-coenzyme A diphosphatase SCS3 n=1 Tax=Zalerion maritima TaxID=339359 RepID=A0AAD5WN28_9PEZI|nr:inositol phospholipid synthesis protein Scs3p [Zalerion maritima]
MDTTQSARLRPSEAAKGNGGGVAPSPPRRTMSPNRTIPYLPTPTEMLAFALYPALLLFGSAFSLVSPETRAAPYDPVAQAHVQDPSVAPSYFARKSNIINKLFVKQGWAWMTGAFVVFVLTHRAFTSGSAQATTRRVKAVIRFGLATSAWILVTQWFFGPALIDRGFRYTGGKCDAAMASIEGSAADMDEMWTAVACKAAGGRWKGGHDISGHIFLLALGSGALLQEMGWVLSRSRGAKQEERCVVMSDGAVKSASVECLDIWEAGASNEGIGIGTKVAAGVVVLSWWMILMTAIYFHTWFEKATGLLVSFSSLYAIYILPRWVPALRATHPELTMAPMKAPSNLPELVRSAFNKAKTNGDLTHFPSQGAVLTANSIPFQVRFAPSLANKPKAPGPDPTKPKVRHDPFADPPAGLKVCDLEPQSHFLVLNKFAITPGHSILATTENKPQSYLLEAADFSAVAACLRAYKERGEELYVFFNSGQHSGASQPHRHLQLLPVEEMKVDLPSDEGPAWDVLSKSVAVADGGEVTEVEAWPFRAFAVDIDVASMDDEKLRELYLELYRRACRAIDDYAAIKGYAVVAEQAHDIGITDGEAWISYNLAITESRMVLAPRMREGGELTDAEGKVVGRLILNGTVLAGTALVKTEAEWNALKDSGEKLEAVLVKIGVPKL